MITYSTWSPDTPAFSRAALIATPPRSAADWSLRPPSRRPIGVRAPATMTDPDMVVPPEVASDCSAETTQQPGSWGCRAAHTSLSAVGRCSTLRSMSTADLPTHLFTAIDHVGIAVADLDEAMAFYRDS